MAEDDWLEDAHPKIDDELISKLQQIIRDESAVIVEHKHYRGSRAPDRFVFDDPDALSRYVTESIRAGDVVYVWKFETVCTDDDMHTYAKMPDADGKVPVKGYY